MTNNQQDQLLEWVAGVSKHNHIDDECCPDFSCCRPELLAPLHERQAFAEADAGSGIRTKMLYAFLGRAIATHKPKAKVYIAGMHDEEPN